MRTKKTKIMVYLDLILVLFLFIGEMRCIGKAIKCNWNPVGAAEVIYTASALTGLGGIVGWIPIKDY